MVRAIPFDSPRRKAGWSPLGTRDTAGACIKMQEATRLVRLNQRPGFAPVLWSSCLAMLAVGANSTAIMAALPRMRAELSLSPTGVQWAVNAYLVVSAASIVLGGRAGDWFGARPGAMAGMAAFAAASVLIAVSDAQAALLAGRSLQGLAAAFAVPCTLAAIDAGAAPERRAQAVGAWTGFLMLGFSIGPLVGGALTDIAGWRAIFWLNALLMLAAMAGTAVSGGAGEASGRARKPAIDWAGFILQAAFMAALIFALQAAPHARAAPARLIGLLALAAGSFILLLAAEARVAAPLIDRKLFSRTDFVMGLAIGSLAMFSIMSLLLYYNLYAQSPQGLALGALEAGASLLPLSAALFAVALAASAITARVGLGAADNGRHGADRGRLRDSGRGGLRRRLADAGDRVRHDGRGPGAALRLGAEARAVGALAGREGAGIRPRQCLHLSGRQFRGRRRGHRFRVRWIRRGSGDDRGRRPDRRRARPFDLGRGAKANPLLRAPVKAETMRSHVTRSAMTDAIAFLSRAIEQGQGLAPADLVLKGGRIFDLVSGELVKSDVAICGDRIVGTMGDYRGAREIDIRGKVVVPGFIDTHCHVESSLLTPLEFDRCVLSHGVTTSICDPHEIANVLGLTGLRYFLDGAMRTAMDLRVQLSSCVPATALETSGARLEADDLVGLADHPKVLGLAEFMNFPGVLARDPSCLAKLAAFQSRPIDGHSPLVTGLRLNGYLSSGVRTDHEVTNLPEAKEKLAKGMQVLVREGSVCKDLHALRPHHHRAQFAVHRLLHRRPQSARHRGRGPSRFCHPHSDQARRAAARRLSRRERFGRAHLRA